MLKISKLFVNLAKAISQKTVVGETSIGMLQGEGQIRPKYHHVKFDGSKNYWPQWTMMKDQTKRMVFRKYYPYRLRYNAMRKAEILPAALKSSADYEIARLPRFSAKCNITKRCAVTSRGRGNVGRWKLSRFIFRHLADYNKLAGVQRGFWS